MNEKDILERIKAKLDEEENNYIQGVLSKSLVVLGEDEAFALRDRQGEGDIRAFKQRVTLDSNGGTLVKVGPVWTVSAQGYEVLAEAAGACVIFPTTVLVDGAMRQNPFVMRDTSNNRILAIYARAVAFRFSSKGIPQVVDWSTVYDVPSYRMIDLLGKAKDAPAAFRLLPNEMDRPETEGTWAKYPFDEHTSLWINTAHPEALTWYASIINREKKAIDFAQTFARRNALKHLLGIQKVPAGGTGVQSSREAATWTLPVLCWRPVEGSVVKWDMTQYAQLVERVEGIVSGKKGFIEKSVKMIAGSERVSDDNLGGGAIEHETEGAPEADLEDMVDRPGPEEKPDEDLGGTSEGPVAPPAPPAPAPAPAPAPKAAPAPTPPGRRLSKKTADKIEQTLEKGAPGMVTLTEAQQAIMNNWNSILKNFPQEAAQALQMENLKAAEVMPEKAAILMGIVSRLLDSGNQE